MADWTIFSLLSWTESYFKSHDIDSPRLTAEILLAHRLGIQRLDLYLQHDRPLQTNELESFKILIQRRIRREPVAYITGKKGFYECDFNVGPGVLIPRPDTETLLVCAIDHISRKQGVNQVLRILELGVGSGAVIISLARAYPSHQYFGCDISDAAAHTARGNSRQHTAGTVHFFRGSFLDAVRPQPMLDIIISNPPYIRSSDINTLMPEVRDYEPALALDGGPDGGDCFRKILETAHHCLASDGRIFLEMGFDQKELLERILGDFPFYAVPEFLDDLGGNNRVAVIKKRFDHSIII